MGCLSSRPQKLEAATVPFHDIQFPSAPFVGNEDVVQLFDDIVRSILNFADTACPRPGPPSPSQNVFEVLDNHAHFKLLTYINRHIYDQIFLPFHPSLDKATSDERKSALESRFQTETASLVAVDWFADFNKLERDLSAKKEDIIQEILTKIIHDFPLPDSTHSGLTNIIRTAYDWKVASHGLVVDTYFLPFFPALGSEYDPEVCEHHFLLEDELVLPTRITQVTSVGLKFASLDYVVGLQFVMAERRKARVLTSGGRLKTLPLVDSVETELQKAIAYMERRQGPIRH